MAGEDRAEPRRHAETRRPRAVSGSWVPGADGSAFGLANLPYGAFTRRPRADRCLGVRIGEFVLDLAPVATEHEHPDAAVLGEPTLNSFMARGPAAWQRVRSSVTSWLADASLRPTVEPHLHPLDEVTLVLPIDVADYVDFYSSEHHATNVGRILRPESPALPANWKHLPIGYHGRSGTVVCTGTPVVRPSGQRKLAGEPAPTFGPSRELDFEAEMAFVVGVPSELGQPVAMAAWREHVFGACILNDWSARDIQAFEYVPLGPFLGKSFLTSISPWVVPLAALESARVDAPPRDPVPLAYLDDADDQWGFDITLEVSLNGQVISRPPFPAMYWTPAQQLAHMTVNGASLRCGDLYASGTVSGPAEGQWGSLLELAWRGEHPLRLRDGGTRVFLHDGDQLVVAAVARGAGGAEIGFGSVEGTVLPAPTST